MPASMREAREVMSEVVTEAWNSACAQIFSELKEIRFKSALNDSDSLPEADAVWARCSIQHTPGAQYQSSLSGANNLIKWQSSGIISVQCFVPLSQDNAYVDAEALAVFIRNILRRVQTCIWFRNCEAIEVGKDSGWYIFNVNASFTYDELM